MKKKERKPNPSYKLPKCKLDPQTKRILAFDPGSRNMGISIIAEINDRPRVVANSIVTHSLFDFQTFMQQRDKFLSELDEWISEYKPNGIIAERFQARGLKGNLGELVSTMMGIMAGHYRTIPIKFITAATWKNAYHRRFDPELEALYKYSKTTPHQLDACFIGIYGLELGLRREFDYDPFKIVAQAEKTSLVRLIERRNRE